MKKHFFTFAILSILLACGNDSSAEADQKQDDENESSATIIDKTPCQLVNESEVKKLFSIPENTPTNIKDVERTYPTCFYKWETITYPVQQTLGGNEVSLEYPTEMTIVLVKNANKNSFETSSKVYKDGETITGIGDMAIWGNTMSQLTFLAKGHLVHLNVKKSNDKAANKAIAEKIAIMIIKNL